VSPRPYRMVRRKAAAEKNRLRILTAARALLLAADFSEFSMEAVARKAGVTRLTVYYQFQSKAGLLEELYNFIARRGHIQDLADVFRTDDDPIRTLHAFIDVFAKFWASDRTLIRRLHGSGAIDAEIGRGLRARNERRRNGARVILERHARRYIFASLEESAAIDTLHMLTSFETFDALAVKGRSLEEVVAMIQKMADHAVGFPANSVPESSVDR
jgi:AcrR family transcriptional regulator